MRRPMLSSIVASDKLAFTVPSTFNLLRQTSVTLVKSAVKLSPEMHAAFKIQLHIDSDSTNGLIHSHIRTVDSKRDILSFSIGTSIKNHLRKRSLAVILTLQEKHEIVH